MVGAALALGLIRDGFSVALVEAHPPPLEWDAETHDLRVSAITRASQRLLDRLGVWPSIRSDRATAYQQMHVWDRAGFGEIHFDAADLGEPDLGHIVENRVIVRALWRAMAGSGVDIVTPAEIRTQECGEHGVSLVLNDGRSLEAGLLVGADGARSQVRDLAGIDAHVSDYEQRAVVATVHAELGNQATAWQRFMPDGPLALLPMGTDLFSIVWSTTPDDAERLQRLDPEEFDFELTDASEGRLGRLTLIGGRAAFPLRRLHAKQYVLPGLALIGDAAHVIHPLAGQGVNLGLLDAGALLDALHAGRERGRAPGMLRTLRAYERARRGHNTATQLAMDGFRLLFGNRLTGVALLRNAGLGLAGRLGPLRRQFERVALGEGVELPSLCRPATGA